MENDMFPEAVGKGKSHRHLEASHQAAQDLRFALLGQEELLPQKRSKWRAGFPLEV